MTSINLFRLTNVILALASIPAAVNLLIIVQRDRKILPPVKLGINCILRFLFASFAVIAIVNATISLALILGLDSLFVDEHTQLLFNTRNTIVNLGILITSWGFVFVHRRARK